MPALDRRPGFVSAAALAGIVGVWWAAHLAAPEAVRAAGLDVWNASAARAELDATRVERAALDARGERIVARMAFADGLAARLLAGETSLAAAVDELAPLYDTDPAWAAELESAHPAAGTARERLGRYLVNKVTWRLGAAPAGWFGLRLAAEAAALAG